VPTIIDGLKSPAEIKRDKRIRRLRELTGGDRQAFDRAQHAQGRLGLFVCLVQSLSPRGAADPQAIITPAWATGR
jgi:hypothetical protein